MSHPFLGGRSQKRQPPSVITGFQIFALRRFVIFFRPDLTGDLRGSRSARPRAPRDSTCGIRPAGSWLAEPDILRRHRSGGWGQNPDHTSRTAMTNVSALRELTPAG